jgi:hypothetical protein
VRQGSGWRWRRLWTHFSGGSAMQKDRGKINGRCGKGRRCLRDRERRRGPSVPIAIVNGDRALAKLRRGIALWWRRLRLDFQREVKEESRGLDRVGF